MDRNKQRADERKKYELCYNHPTLNYGMGGTRMADAIIDLKWALGLDCESYLDIGCGRAEMLEHAEALGFDVARGTEIVNILCDHVRVWHCAIHNLHIMPAAASPDGFDLVTSFDVIEHLLPGDDELLLVEMGRIARHCMAVTANNRPSVDPNTQNDLHINKRPYDEWDRIIRDLWEPDWTVERMTDKSYVSETWRAWR